MDAADGMNECCDYAGRVPTYDHHDVFRLGEWALWAQEMSMPFYPSVYRRSTCFGCVTRGQILVGLMIEVGLAFQII